MFRGSGLGMQNETPSPGAVNPRLHTLKALTKPPMPSQETPWKTQTAKLKERAWFGGLPPKFLVPFCRRRPFFAVPPQLGTKMPSPPLHADAAEVKSVAGNMMGSKKAAGQILAF